MKSENPIPSSLKIKLQQAKKKKKTQKHKKKAYKLLKIMKYMIAAKMYFSFFSFFGGYFVWVIGSKMDTKQNLTDTWVLIYLFKALDY